MKPRILLHFGRQQEAESALVQNIAYTTDAIAQYFGTNRRQWEQFYPSERWLVDRVATRGEGRLGRVLDVGCAAGGLGAALCQRYAITHYTGIDINTQAIAAAKAAADITVPHAFLAGDVTADASLKDQVFDTVFNLSCADWNVDFQGILDSSWSHVAPGGTMIISLRLTDGRGERNFEKSYQFIHYGDVASLPGDAECAAYVVLNISEALGELARLRPERILGYGYWGSPSAMARTPFARLAFVVFAITKPLQAGVEPVVELHLPADIWSVPAT